MGKTTHIVQSHSTREPLTHTYEQSIQRRVGSMPQVPSNGARRASLDLAMDALEEENIAAEKEQQAKAKAKPKRKKGARRDTEDKWLEEAENMLRKGEADDAKWLDDIEEDIATILNVSKRRGPKRT